MKYVPRAYLYCWSMPGTCHDVTASKAGALYEAFLLMYCEPDRQHARAAALCDAKLYIEVNIVGAIDR